MSTAHSSTSLQHTSSESWRRRSLRAKSPLSAPIAEVKSSLKSAPAEAAIVSESSRSSDAVQGSEHCARVRAVNANSMEQMENFWESMVKTGAILTLGKTLGDRNVSAELNASHLYIVTSST